MDPEDSTTPSIVAALVAAQSLARPVTVGNAVPAAVVPDDCAVELLEKTLAAPTRTRGNFPVATGEAFNRAVKLLRGETKGGREILPELPIFFGRSDTNAVVQAVLNFTDWRDLLVTLSQKLSDPFLDWYRLNNQAQGQKKFALFLEERTAHVVKPEGAALLELAKKFKANVSVRYQSIVDDQNGDASLEFLQTSDAGSAGAKSRMKVPNFITLFLPVWHGGEPVKIEARFGYAISDDGKLALTFEILRLNELLTEELRKIVEAIGKAHVNSIVIEGANALVPNL